MLRTKPNILQVFHDLFSPGTFRRVQSLLRTAADGLAHWQRGLAAPKTPADEPPLMRDTIFTYRLYAASQFKSHFTHSLQMWAGWEFYDNWSKLSVLIRNKGDDRGAEVKEEHRALCVWYEGLPEDRPLITGENHRARLNSTAPTTETNSGRKRARSPSDELDSLIFGRMPDSANGDSNGVSISASDTNRPKKRARTNAGVQAHPSTAEQKQKVWSAAEKQI